MTRKPFPYLPEHKLETVGRYLLGKSCEQIQMHPALDDAKLAAMMRPLHNYLPVIARSFSDEAIPLITGS